MSKLKLLTMSDIPAEEVRWLWYPYLPRGKITIIQGDPGEGNKDTTFSIRIASSDLDIIRKKAKQARMSQSDYVTRCCLGRQVVVIEDLKETAKQLRAIGGSLNRLTVLANMGRVEMANLDGLARELARVSTALREIQERGRWNR